MRGFVLGIIFALTATIANAEGPAPEARVALSQNMDFYGSDLKIIFDTTYDACESACLSDTACQAFTFNQRSGSCFPKSEVTQATPFAGAISARVYRLSQAALDQADRRA